MSASAGPKIVAFGGGKGGIGKSLAAANVAMNLAAMGKDVVLVDAAFGGPTLHAFTGVAKLARSLGDYVRAPSVEVLAGSRCATPLPTMTLISAAGDRDSVRMPATGLASKFIGDLRQLECEWVVLDLASGCAPFTLELFIRADIPVALAIPDQASVEQLFTFLRAAFTQRLAMMSISASLPSNDLAAPLDLYLHALGDKQVTAHALGQAMLGFVPHLVVNSARSKADMELGRAVASAGHRRLGLPIDYLANLEYDEAVWAATRRRRPVILEFPESRAAKGFEKTARSLLTVRPPRLDGAVLPSDNHYDLLEVHPTASFEDIRRANRRMRDIYSPDSIAIAGLYDPATLEAAHRRFDLAYTTLMDAVRRREYDLALYPDGPPSQLGAPLLTPHSIPSTTAAPPRHIRETRPPMPPLAADTSFDGALLKHIREAFGLTLRELSERSKIGMQYLEALEADAFDKLPAPVYVKGFLGEYARLFGLDAARVRATYVGRLEPAAAEAE
ncbi:MAG: helix-turn-helix domain-containing protein [Myxococcales bacterium]|nr:helix-turn-helix domain-containing protein [Myxococcales bacterium]